MHLPAKLPATYRLSELKRRNQFIPAVDLGLKCRRSTRAGSAGNARAAPSAQTSSTVEPDVVHVINSHVEDSTNSGHAELRRPALPSGIRIAQLSQQPGAESLPFMLYLPDIDGAGVTSSAQHQAWSERFEMHSLMLEAEAACSFAQLAAGVGGWLEAELAQVPPERPVYLLGEGFGAVLALQLAWDCRRLVNRLILVNPATSFQDSPLSRVAGLLERVPPALLAAPPAFPFPLPFQPPPLPLPLVLAPMLGTSPQALVRQVFGSISSQNPADAVKALSRAVGQMQQIASRLTPSTLLHRLKMLEEGINSVEPRLGRIPQRCLILAGGEDVVLGSAKEAERLVEKLQRAFKKVLPDSGHALLNEPGGALLPLLEAEGFYTTTRAFSSPLRPGADVNAFGTAGPVEVPSPEEVSRYAASWTSRLREFNSPVFLSTLPDGSRVQGLDGLPSRLHRLTHTQHVDTAQEQHERQERHSHHQPSSEAGMDGGGASTSGDVEAEAAGGGGGADMAEDWGEGPILFVGNHQLYAFDMSVMVEEVLLKRGILMRGLAHPGLFRQPGADEEAEQKLKAKEAGEQEVEASGKSGSSGDKDKDKSEDGLPPAFMGNMFQSFGAVRVTPTAMFRLLAAGEAVLLYPGGVREGFKRRNEKYELFWPARSEFVRMAARFNATIIPVSAVGLEDSLSLLLDSDELRNSPLWSEKAREQAAAAPRARVGVAVDEALDESFIPPLIAPAVPSRWYFLFGKPVRTSQDMYKDRAACDEVYSSVRSEVEDGISFLLRKREQDPHREFLSRYVYEQNPPFGPKRVAPTFKL